MLNDVSKTKRELLVGRTKKMLDDGMTVTEIAKKLNIPESTVRSCKEIIDKAEANRK